MHQPSNHLVSAAWRLLAGGALLTSILVGQATFNPSASAATTEVKIVDFNFDTPSVTLAAGDTLHWTNPGRAPHPPPADDGSWDSGSLTAGATFDQVFNTPGTFTYFCAIHPSMKGTIVVSGGAPAAPAAEA